MSAAPVSSAPARTADRRAALAAAAAAADLDAVLVTRGVNVRYLTGLEASNAAVLVGADGSAVLATDGRYAQVAAQVAPELELLVDRAVAVALVRRAGAVDLGIEEHDVTLELDEQLRAAGPARLRPARRAVESLREVKDDAELAALSTACSVSCRALEDLLAGPLRGRRESEIARDLEGRLVALGASGPAFPTIVAAGPHSAVPHHQPTDRVVDTGDLLTIDFGALVDGYHADCTRTVLVGAAPSAWQAEVYEVVAAAQAAGVAALAVGVEARSVDATTRAVVADAGYGDAFPHGTGHGVGLEIHEAPLLGYAAPGRLRDRTAVTVEPGIYLPGRGGVRIEDTLVVRASAGGPHSLTTTPRELLVVDG